MWLCIAGKTRDVTAELCVWPQGAWGASELDTLLLRADVEGWSDGQQECVRLNFVEVISCEAY